MQFRQELKYVISEPERILLLRRLNGALAPDPYARPDGTYLVRTLYFDDLFSTALRDAEEGAPCRQKYRLRMYNGESGFLRLERKIKRMGAGAKPSATVSRAEADMLIRGDFAFLAEKSDPFLLRAYADARSGALRPRRILEYTRAAFVAGEDARVTVDSGIRVSERVCGFFDARLAGRPLSGRDGQCVLEIKYGDFLPGWLPALLDVGNRPRTAFSKFAGGAFYE